MIINRKHKPIRSVEFVSYDGKYPNLCRGVLTVKIDGELVNFGHHYSNYHWDKNLQKWIFTDEDPYNPNYEIFWESGGSIETCNCHIGEWKINVDNLPEEFWNIADELDNIINENVPYGCCGGCI